MPSLSWMRERLQTCICLTSELVQIKDWQQHSKNNEQHNHTHDKYDGWLKKSQCNLDQPADFIFLIFCNPLQHGFQLTACLTARNHVNTHRWKIACLL